MLVSGATHSLIHSSVVSLMPATMLKGALLTVTVVNRKWVVCNDIAEIDLVFLAQVGEHQVRIKAVIYVLEGLSTDVILDIVFFEAAQPINKLG